MIIVWGNVEAKPEHCEQLLQLSMEHVRRSRAEPGCITHQVHIDVENRNRLVFIEQWENIAALHAHFAVPASIKFVKNAAALAIAPPEIKIFNASRVN